MRQEDEYIYGIRSNSGALNSADIFWKRAPSESLVFPLSFRESFPRLRKPSRRPGPYIGEYGHHAGDPEELLGKDRRSAGQQNRGRFLHALELEKQAEVISHGFFLVRYLLPCLYTVIFPSHEFVIVRASFPGENRITYVSSLRCLSSFGAQSARLVFRGIEKGFRSFVALRRRGLCNVGVSDEQGASKGPRCHGVTVRAVVASAVQLFRFFTAVPLFFRCHEPETNGRSNSILVCPALAATGKSPVECKSTSSSMRQYFKHAKRVYRLEGEEKGAVFFYPWILEPSVFSVSSPILTEKPAQAAATRSQNASGRRALFSREPKTRIPPTLFLAAGTALKEGETEGRKQGETEGGIGGDGCLPGNVSASTN